MIVLFPTSTVQGKLFFSFLLLLLLLLLLSHFSRVRLCVAPQTAAHQAPRPWVSPCKNTGVSCHFLLQCMKVKSESEVAPSCPTLSDPMDCSLPGSSIHGIFQARVLEWGAIAFSQQIQYVNSTSVFLVYKMLCEYLPVSKTLSSKQVIYES